eukprot:COSAG01_NODE_17253_length_1166_cov_1.559513_1_plen_193_part_00
MRRSFFFTLLIITLFLITCIFVPRMAQFLIVDDRPKAVDAIIVLSGGNGARVKKAVDLYQAGYARHMVMTGSAKAYFATSTLQLMRDYAVSLGVSDSCIQLEKESQSTLDHMYYLRPWIAKHNWEKVMIVTSAFHTARSARVFRKGWHDLPVEIVVIAAPDHIDVKHWWQHYEMIETVLSEWFRYVLYLFRI